MHGHITTELHIPVAIPGAFIHSARNIEKPGMGVCIMFLCANHIDITHGTYVTAPRTGCTCVHKLTYLHSQIFVEEILEQ